MGKAIGEVLPYAVGVAISPVPIIAVILVLFSPRARSNGPAFLIGWMFGLAAVVTVVYVVADASDVSTNQDASDSSYWLKFALGLLLLGIACRNWRKQQALPEGQEPPQPKWMAAIDSFTPLKTAGLAVLLSAVNPKNLALAVAAAASVAQGGSSTSEAVVGLAVFVVLASLSIGGPVILYLAGGDRAADTLEGWKSWLAANNPAVMAGLFLVFGAVLIGQALVGLSG